MASEDRKQIMGTHFKAFRQQLEYLGDAAATYSAQHQASPFACIPVSESTTTGESSAGPAGTGRAERVLPEVKHDCFETQLGALLSADTGGLSNAWAGTLFAQLVAGHNISASLKRDKQKDLDSPAENGDSPPATAPAAAPGVVMVTVQHRALAVTVLRRTRNMAALHAFLQGGHRNSNGLKTVVKWLYISASSKDPPVSLTLLQHILEWLTGCHVDHSPSSAFTTAITAATDSTTAMLLQDLYRRSEKLFAADRDRDSACSQSRFMVGFEHAVQFLYPPPGSSTGAIACSVASTNSSAMASARAGVQACVLGLYRQLLHLLQVAQRMPMQSLSSGKDKLKGKDRNKVAVAPASPSKSALKTTASADGGLKKRPLGTSSSTERDSEEGSESQGHLKKTRTTMSSGGAGVDMLSQFLGGGATPTAPSTLTSLSTGKVVRVGEKDKNKNIDRGEAGGPSMDVDKEEVKELESASGIAPPKSNRKLLKRSGRQRRSVSPGSSSGEDDLLVIVPFSTGEKKRRGVSGGEDGGLDEDTAHNKARRKLRWGDEAEGEAAIGLLHIREFEVLPPYEPDPSESSEALAPGGAQRKKQGLRGRQPRDAMIGSATSSSSPTSPPSSSYSRKERTQEREQALQWREEQQQRRRLELRARARAVQLPPSAPRWTRPGPVRLSAEQLLLAGECKEVDSKERKLQTQRIGLKIELCYFTEQDIPRDPETPAKSSQQQLAAQLVRSRQQGGGGDQGSAAVQIPWLDVAVGGLDYAPQEQNAKQEGETAVLAAAETSAEGSRSRSSEGGEGDHDFSSFEKRLLHLTDNTCDKRRDSPPLVQEEAAEEEVGGLLDGLPEYVTMLDEGQLEMLLEQLMQPAHAHLLEDSSHPGFLQLVGNIAPGVRDRYLQQQSAATGRSNSNSSPRKLSGGRKSRFSDINASNDNRNDDSVSRSGGSSSSSRSSSSVSRESTAIHDPYSHYHRPEQQRPSQPQGQSFAREGEHQHYQSPRHHQDTHSSPPFISNNIINDDHYVSDDSPFVARHHDQYSAGRSTQHPRGQHYVGGSGGYRDSSHYYSHNEAPLPRHDYDHNYNHRDVQAGRGGWCEDSSGEGGYYSHHNGHNESFNSRLAGPDEHRSHQYQYQYQANKKDIGRGTYY